MKRFTFLILSVWALSFACNADELARVFEPDGSADLKSECRIYRVNGTPEWEQFRLEIVVKPNVHYRRAEQTVWVDFPTDFTVWEPAIWDEAGKDCSPRTGTLDIPRLGVKTINLNPMSLDHDGEAVVVKRAFWRLRPDNFSGENLKYSVSFAVPLNTISLDGVRMDSSDLLSLIEVEVSLGTVPDYLAESTMSIDKEISSKPKASSQTSSKAVKLLYGTTRDRDGRTYGSSFQPRLELGTIVVGMPEYRQRQYWTDAADLKTFAVTTPIFGRSAALKFLSDELKRDKKDHVLIFVHGFNVSFNEAAFRTAQLYRDAGLDEDHVPAFFSWPSEGKPLLYKTDQDGYKLAYRTDAINIKKSNDAFREFLSMLSKETEGKEICLIFHSMGNRLLTENIEFIKKLELDRVISVAGDESIEVFRDSMHTFDRYDPDGNKLVTLYASKHDIPLYFSEKVLHQGQRVGQGGDRILVFDQGTSVDVSDFFVPGENISHSTVFRYADTLNDLQLLFGHRPNWQRERRKADSGGFYYHLPRKNR